MAENLPIKHSLSEAIHNSSISKIDVQSQHPTYPLEDIDQERLFEIRIQTITSDKTDQVSNHHSKIYDQNQISPDDFKPISGPHSNVNPSYRTSSRPGPVQTRGGQIAVWPRPKNFGLAKIQTKTKIWSESMKTKLNDLQIFSS